MVCSLVSVYFDSAQHAHTIKKLYKNLDYCSRDMLDFNFSEKVQGVVSLPYFVHDFSRKLFHRLHSDN